VGAGHRLSKRCVLNWLAAARRELLTISSTTFKRLDAVVRIGIIYETPYWMLLKAPKEKAQLIKDQLG
jgi:hypothetical protein